MHATLLDHDIAPETPAGAAGGRIAVTFGDPMVDSSYASVTISGTRLTAAQQRLVACMATAYPRHRIIVTCHHERLGGEWAPTALCDDFVAAVGRAPEFWYWGYSHLGITFAGVDTCPAADASSAHELALGLGDTTVVEIYCAGDGRSDVTAGS